MSEYSAGQVASINAAATNIASAIIKSGNEWRPYIVAEHGLNDHLVDVVLGSAFLIAAVSALASAYNLDASSLGKKLNEAVQDYADKQRNAGGRSGQ